LIHYLFLTNINNNICYGLGMDNICPQCSAKNNNKLNNHLLLIIHINAE
jgi:hypothetical protein